MREYEAITQIYQAQNAIGIARTANAAQLAPNTLSEAEGMLAEARRLQSTHADTSLISQSARAAVQTAEDARLIAERRAQEQDLAAARSTAATAEQEKLQAQADAQRAKAEADAARAQIDAERSARQQAEAAAAVAEARVAPVGADRASVPLSAPPPPRRRDEAEQKSLARMRMLESLNGVLPARDTPRGLVVTVPDQAFNGAALRAGYSERLARVAAMLGAETGLRATIEGSTDNAATESLAMKRAYEVRDAMTRAGLPSSSVEARGLGASRPLASNGTESGRSANRRVEIVISGSTIGDIPFWDHTYSISRR
jgi:flagellar motor protein MotB